MAEKVAIVTLKDGTKIDVTDLAELSKYSERQDLDSISFFGDDALAPPMESAAPAPIPAALINASLTIDTDPKQETKTVATIEQPKSDPVVPKPQPAGDGATTITITIGALAGALSSAGMPALSNLAKNFLKNKLKGKKGSEKGEEQEEPTDCKTHQLKTNAKFTKLAARISALESKNSGDSSLGKLNSEDTEELIERIEKLEKALKAKSSKGKR
jgi:hypothetical protein